MKKLMIAAAIVCATVAVQASTVNWSEFTSISEPEGADTVADGTAVYLIRTADHDRAAFLEAFVAAGSAASFASTIASWSTVDPASISDGAFEVTAAESTSFTLKDAEAAYFALVSGDNIFISDSIPALYNEAGGADDYTFAYDPQWGSYDVVFDAKGGLQGEYEGQGWYTTSSVPEPTSGLLLLLGVAGLALRRRRA